MATYGYQPPGPQEQVVDPWAMPLPWETFDQYRARLFRDRQQQYNQQQQDAQSRMQMQASYARQAADMRADAAYQASQRAMQGSRNQMTLTDLAYNTAVDKEQERRQRVGSVSQSFRNAGLGQY